MFRVTLREMFWLCTVVALAMGWMIDAKSEQTEDQFRQIQLMEQRLQEASGLVRELEAIAKGKLDGEVKLAE